MHVDFLLGPAGSGKTRRCLQEIRAALADPDGPPLLLLAPKQATFQLERQILADGGIGGYARLQILSFERLADLVLEHFDGVPPRLLEEEGRLMVLRALLMERQSSLRIFHATARLPGFARQLSLLLRECQRSRMTPARLEELSARFGDPGPLGLKLADLAVLLRSYLEWLAAAGLQDANCLLDLATDRLLGTSTAGAAAAPPLRLGGVWLDGFAEMTPQELDLLAAVIPCADRATLAFCLDHQPSEDPNWLSTWAVVGQTFRRCWLRLQGLAGVALRSSLLPRGGPGRFAASPALAHLEANWVATEPRPFVFSGDGVPSPGPLGIVRCATPEAEAVAAAREVLRHVREGGGRFREVAVLLRSLDSHHVPLRRVFTRYGIPFFMDRREPAGHHPLAELTRSALRIAALHWQHEDVFSALKTGLAGVAEDRIDALENAALANGWGREAWQAPLRMRDESRDAAAFEEIRQRWIKPFEALQAGLAADGGEGPTGRRLAEAIRRLWEDFGVAEILEEWAERAEVHHRHLNSIHLTVQEEMHSWLRNLELAFADRPMPLREWLPILEAGLGGLTVGVIPPAVDQVLIGAVDRSRSPDVRLVLLLGMNEGQCPALPSAPKILTETERRRLQLEANAVLGPGQRVQLGHERYYGYIACTRASERLVLTCAASGADGKPLNPSPFLAQVQRLFPEVHAEEFSGGVTWDSAVHAAELAPLLLRSDRLRAEGVATGLPEAVASGLAELPEFSELVRRQRDLLASGRAERVSAAAVGAMYGGALRTSVSALEDFSACPFKFFVARGLGARERELFEPDVRELGSFQHELLRLVHQEATRDRARWRDLDPAEAGALVRRLGGELLHTYRGGLFQTSAESRFAGARLVKAIESLFVALVRWMPQYGFDPVAVEFGFGLEPDGVPHLEMDLGDGRSLALRGRIDRIDLCPSGDGGPPYGIIIDYKSSDLRLHPVKLANGLQLQLLTYVEVLRSHRPVHERLGVPGIEPGGVFYVNLSAPSATHPDAGTARESAGQKAYQHRGRFRGDLLEYLDARGAASGDQFAYRLKKDGGFYATSTDPMEPTEFRALVQDVNAQLGELGRRILSGEAGVLPYQFKKERACDRCEFRAVCRFDPWTGSFRVLREVASAAPGGGAEGE